MREQRKEGADFTTIYETGRDRFAAGVFTTPYQYTEAELAAAVAEANRLGLGPGHGVAVHATGEPGTGFAVEAGVASVDHAYNLSAQTMAMMKAKGIPAVPTFAIAEYFAAHAASLASAERQKAELAFHAEQFRLQMKAGVPFAVGSDVGPFPHGTQARELELMVQDRRDKAGFLGGCHRRRRRSGAGYFRDDAGAICDEGRGRGAGEIDGSGKPTNPLIAMRPR